MKVQGQLAPKPLAPGKPTARETSRQFAGVLAALRGAEISVPGERKPPPIGAGKHGVTRAISNQGLSQVASVSGNPSQEAQALLSTISVSQSKIESLRSQHAQALGFEAVGLIGESSDQGLSQVASVSGNPSQVQALLSATSLRQSNIDSLRSQYAQELGFEEVGLIGVSSDQGLSQVASVSRNPSQEGQDLLSPTSVSRSRIDSLRSQHAQALGFEEVGLIGARASQYQAVATTKINKPAGREPKQTPQEPFRESDLVGVMVKPHSGSSLYPASGGPLFPPIVVNVTVESLDSSVAATLLDGQPSSPGIGDVEAMSGEPVGPPADGGPPKHQTSSPKQSPNHINLVEQGGRLHLSMGTQPLAAQSIFILRSIAAEMIDDSGSSLGEFRLNGLVIERRTSFSNGDSDGNFRS